MWVQSARDTVSFIWGYGVSLDQWFLTFFYHAFLK